MEQEVAVTILINMNIQNLFTNAKFIDPPISLQELALSYGVTGFSFIDGPNFSNSIRLDSQIAINARGTYWGNLILPPVCARTYFEAILLRTLHEIGHHYYKHPGNIGVSGKGLVIPRTGDSDKDAFGGIEGEAWKFALDYRLRNPENYNSLQEEIREVLNAHDFSNHDWEEDSSNQFYKLSRRHLEKEIFKMKGWLIEEYCIYIDKNLKIQKI